MREDNENMGLRGSDQSALFQRPVSERFKWGLYYSAWGAVVLVTLVSHPAQIITAPCFPVGFAGIFPNWGGKTIAAWALSFVIGWAIYFGLSWLISRTRKMGAFLLIYIVFCILLALNVVGCQGTLNAVSGIQ